MKPILLSHEKPITDIKFNVDGDLLFTSCKAKGGSVTVWWSDNGERIGTFDGHNGAIYSVDVNRLSTRLVSGAADGTVKLWDVETGQCLYSFFEQTQNTAAVRCVSFAEGDQRFLCITDAAMNHHPSIFCFKVTDDPQDQKQNSRAQFQIAGPNLKEKITKGLWGRHNQSIVTSHTDGYIRIYSTETGKEACSARVHDKEIGDLRWDKYHGLLITASKDGSAKLIDSRNLEVVKTYFAGRPLNSAAISPLMDHVILGGGEQAVDAALSAANNDQFKTLFYHSIFAEELGSIMGHFGPVNVLNFSPDGRCFASGGEDGFVRLHYMDSSYFSRTDEISQYL